MSAESGAQIRYTTDGSNPTSNSTLYSSAITLNATTTVKAIAIKDGVTSSVASATFTKSEQPVSGRTITVDGTEVAEGGTTNHTKQTAATVVVTLPAGDSLIGQKPAYGYATDSAELVDSVTLAEGSNTFTIPSSAFTGVQTFYVGAGEEGFPKPTWLGTFCTLNVVE